MTTSITRRKFLGGVGAASAALAMPGIVLGKSKYTLKISHYMPATHGFQTDFIEPWAKALREKSGGAIDYKIYDTTTAFGRADRQADQVRAGVVDIAFGMTGIPRGRFPHSSVMELPFVVTTADTGSRTLWQLHQDGRLGQEYDDYKVLLLMTHEGAFIHTVDRPVYTLDDLKGLRLRSPGPAVNAMLEYEGASPITLAPAQIYQALSKGAIDGLTTTWDLVATVHANEVLNYHTDCRLYAAAFYFLMNPQSYKGLPAELQALIDETTGEALLDKVGPWWRKWEHAGKQDAIKRDQEIIVIDDAERNQWRKELEPMIDNYLTSLESSSFQDPHALYKEALNLINKYET